MLEDKIVVCILFQSSEHEVAREL